MSAVDLRPPLTPLFDTFGVAITVTPKGQSPLDATGIWDGDGPPVSPYGEFVAGHAGHSGNRANTDLPARPTMCVRLDETGPLYPHGAEIEAPLLVGGSSETWHVDEVEVLDGQVLRLHLLHIRNASP